MAVAVTITPAFSTGTTRRLFRDRELWDSSRLGTKYDVSADGQRFVLVETLADAAPAIHVVQNWFAEFRDRR